MKKLSVILAMLVVSIYSVCVFGASITSPCIYYDSVSILEGNMLYVSFSYGSTATSVSSCISSRTAVAQAEIVGTNIYLLANNEGTTNVTLIFDDGSTDTLSVTVVDSGSSSSTNTVSIENGRYIDTYINLTSMGATRATITYDSDYVSINKSTFTSSDDLRITGKKVGESTVKIKYSTGDSVYLNVIVLDTFSTSNAYETIIMEYGDKEKIYVNLSKYSAKSARVSFNGDFLDIDDYYTSSSKYITLESDGEGVGELTVTYSTGDIEYYFISSAYDYRYTIDESNYVSTDYITLSAGSSEYFDICLGDCSNASISVASSSVGVVSHSKIYSDTSVLFTGLSAGTSKIEIEYSNGDVRYIAVVVTAASTTVSTPYSTISTTKVETDGRVKLEIYMGSATYVIIDTEDSDILTVDEAGYNYSTDIIKLYEDKYDTVIVYLVADKPGEVDVSVKFSTGVSVKHSVEVVEYLASYTAGISIKGDNYELKPGIFVNDVSLSTGYIAGFEDGTFRASNNITRQEFAVMLSSILDSNATVSVSDYISDVTAPWSKHSVAELSSLNIIDKSELFRPTDAITRYEVVEILYNVLDLSEYETTCGLKDTGMSTLDKKIAKFYNSGLISGYSDGTFGGSNSITRGEVVTILNRIFFETMTTTGTNIFSDVSSTDWYYSAVVKAATGI